MDTENRQVLRKIIAGVETGGQRYGVFDYAAYAGPATNTKNEITAMASATTIATMRGLPRSTTAGARERSS